MADDDIDIEEHNLLDNPIVKNMFPDISIFKTEITDTNDEVPMEEFSLKSEQNENWSTNVYFQNYPTNNHFVNSDSVTCIRNKNNARVKQYYNVRKLKQSTTHPYQTFNSSGHHQSHIYNNTYPQQQDVKEFELYNVKNEDNSVNESSKSIINIKNETNDLFEVVKTETKTIVESRDMQCTDKIGILGNLFEGNCFDIENKIIFEKYNVNAVNSNMLQTVKPVTSTVPTDYTHIENNSYNVRDILESEQVSSKAPDQLPFIANKFIIGSKPNVAGNKKTNKLNISSNAKVLLENLENFLNKSNRYCKLCLRLFPSNKTFTDHVRLKHSQKNIQTESTETKSLDHKHMKRYRCNLCKTVCTSLSFLSRHRKIVHSKKNDTRKIESGSVSNNQLQVFKAKKGNSNFQCTHCSKNFTSRKLLIDHMYTVLQSKNKDGKELVADVKEKDSNTKPLTSNENYYRCMFCLSYFAKEETTVRHIEKIHKRIIRNNLQKVAFEKECRQCTKEYSTVNSFNVHVWKYHRKKSCPLNKKSKFKNKKILSTKKKSAAINSEQKAIIKDGTNKQYTNNTRKKLRKHEKHPIMNHKKILTNKNGNFALKSTIFKCMKCDIYFLSENNAADHIKHMDLLVNWKCLKCLRIFKKEDELLHNQQHIFSDTFDVFEISDADSFYFLYKCSNCVTYFLEEDLSKHYSICEKQTPMSAYCKICDILVDNNIIELHNEHHDTNGVKFKNIFIDSELLMCNEELSMNECNEKSTKTSILDSKLEESKKHLEENSVVETTPKTDCSSPIENKKIPTPTPTDKMLSFTYCDKCNSYISSMHNLYNHTKDPCNHLVMFVCKHCGLLISSKLINRHRKLHERIPGLTLNEFKFYDLKGKKINHPPIPKYPSCNVCLKHFITKTAIISHKCSEDFLSCSVCGIKLSSSAFPLHMAFHNYLPINNASRKFNDKTLSDLTNETNVLTLNVPEASSLILDSKRNHENKQLFVFTCKNCKVAIDVYDRVIEHSQEHISNQVTEKQTRPCDLCNLLFDVTCYDNHKTLHANNPNKKFTVLSFDVFYATADINIWFDHLFGALPKGEIDRILCKSIYDSERRIKFRIIQDGLPHLTLYKCAKCESIVNASTVYEHCHFDILCYKSKSVRCSYCNILLESEKTRIEHEKIHDDQNITRKLYRIVLFNCEEDKHINHVLSLPSNYVLFECRNCNGIVDKTQYQEHKCNSDDLSKCSHCGLLLYSIDYMPHVLKHKEFCSYTEKNMKVISIGYIKAHNKAKSRMRPSFRGMKLDYLLYQCAKCRVCVTEKQDNSTHECIEESSITKCLDCDLYFEDSQFRKHRMFHKNDIYFVKENITVEQFGCTKMNPFIADVIVIEDEDDMGNVVKSVEKCNKAGGTNDHSEEIPFDEVVEQDEEIFKCKCGLHFLTEASALSHFKKCNNSRSATQTCSKCGLHFKTSVLFDHLLAHHGSKNISFNFNIIDISTRC